MVAPRRGETMAASVHGVGRCSSLRHTGKSAVIRIAKKRTQAKGGTMAWLPSKGVSLITRRIHSSPIEVTEPVGYTGEWVTVKASLKDVGRYRTEPLRIRRNGRTLTATRKEAQEPTP